jgi:hypothetical protein
MLEALLAAGPNKAAEGAWYDSLLDWLGRVGELLTALLGAIALIGLGWGFYRRTLGRRRDRYGRLARLGTNAQISFFSSVLGEPPAMRRTEEATVTRYDDNGNAYLEPKAWTECVWIDRDFYVHAVADEDETIQAYSVTTRSKRFRPRFRQPGAFSVDRGRIARVLRRPDYKLHPKIKLGRTRFHELGRPEQAAAWIGAHNVHYFEAYWGANPGYYQHFVYSINDAGYGAWHVPWDYERMHDFAWGFGEFPVSPTLALVEIAARADGAGTDTGLEPTQEVVDADPADEPLGAEEYVEEPLPTFYENFRRKARINTYAVIGPDLALDDYAFYTPPPQGYPTTFGPNSGRTRTLAGEHGESS